MTQQNAALVEESTAAADSMSEQAQHLAQVVATFQLSDAQDAPLSRPVRTEQPRSKALAAIGRRGSVPPANYKKTGSVASLPVPAVSVKKPMAAATKQPEGDWETF